MITKNMLVLAAVVCGTMATASADDVYLTGSSAFRGSVMKYLRDHISGKKAVFDKAAGTDLTASIDASTYIIISGTYAGKPITVYCAWTGSVAGVRTVVNSEAVAYPSLPADWGTNAAYSLTETTTPGNTGAAGHLGVQGTSANAQGNITSASFTHVPDFGFSDVYQVSTPYNDPQLRDIRVAVLPFKWVASKGAQASGVTNVTPQIAQTLWVNGTVNLIQFNSAANATYKVYAMGRNDDSGTRLTAMAETGVGTSSLLTQFYPNGNPVTSWTLTDSTGINPGNDGYVSGGTLAGAMGNATTAANGHAVTYLSVGDAATAITAGGTECSHNGVFYSSQTDVIEGKYTFWTYEHIYDRGNLDSTTQAGSLLLDLQSNLPTSFVTGPKTIQLGDMHCRRSADGDVVYHD